MRKAHIALVFAAFTSAACSDSHRGGSPTDSMNEPIESEAAYVQARAEVELSRTERCCKEAGARAVDGEFIDAILGGLRENKPSPESGARYDAQAAADCLAEIADWPCHNPKEPFAIVADSACGRVYQRGDRAIGESCESYLECAKNDGAETTCTVSEVTRDGILRACKLLEHAGEGEPCASQNPRVTFECEWPLLCHESAGICVARAERGEQCLTGPAWGDTCALGSVCDRLDTATCIEPIPEGEPCDDGELCESLACAGGLCRPAIFDSWACIW